MYITFAMNSSSKAPTLSGFFVETAEVTSERSVFRRDDLFLYKNGCCMWILGEQAGDTNGLAFIEATADSPGQLPLMSAEHNWRVALEGQWVADPAFYIVSGDHQRCADILVRHRDIKNQTARARHDALTRCSEYRTVFEILHLIRDDGRELVPSAQLHTGAHIPLVGFGTGATPRGDVLESVMIALKVGYRLLDTASIYDNEDLIGQVLAGENYTRSDIFLISKHWYTELGFQETLKAAERSLRRLNTDYIDLYLIHWPVCYPEIEWMDCSNLSGGTWQQSWRALEKLYAEGRLTNIGVSNFHEGLTGDLLDMASTTPHAVQNYLDPAHPDSVVELCREEAIFYQAYSSLRGFISASPGPEYYDAAIAIRKVAQQVKREPAQVILRWLVQQGIGIIPRSSSPEHIEANLDVLNWKLDELQLQSLNKALGLDHSDEDWLLHKNFQDEL